MTVSCDYYFNRGGQGCEGRSVVSLRITTAEREKLLESVHPSIVSEEPQYSEGGGSQNADGLGA